jgi:uncharacterized membrane protein YczE
VSPSSIAPAAPRPQASTRTRYGIFAVAISGVGIGVGLMIEAHLGVAPNDVLSTGLADTLGWGVGTASWLTSGVAMLLAWALGRRPRLPTVLGGVFVGLSINGMLAALPTPDGLPLRWGFLLLGLCVVWAAITGVVSADVGAGPLELVMLALMDRRVSIRVARWGIELTLLGLGLALGGSAGIGTALFAFGTGPVLSITLPWGSARTGIDLTHPVEVVGTT